MSFDAAVRLAPGNGLTARIGNSILVLPAGPPVDGGLLRRFLDPAVDDTIDAITEYAEEADGSLPAFVCLSWERRVRIVVHGDAELVTDHSSLPMISGTGSGTWVERTLSKVPSPIRIDVCCREEAAVPWTNLGCGVVAAAGVSITLLTTATDARSPERSAGEPNDRPTESISIRDRPQPAPSAPLTADGDAQATRHEPSTPASDPNSDSMREEHRTQVRNRSGNPLDDVFADSPVSAAPQTRTAADVLADDLFDGTPVEPPRTDRLASAPPSRQTPMPPNEELTFVPSAKPEVAEMVRRNGVTGAAGLPTIEASVCGRCGAANPAAASRCQVCDALMPPTTTTVFVPRPALGRIVFDDGTTESLDVGLLLGRNPRNEETLEECRVVKLAGEKLSRLHAEIQLRNWDVFVVDRGSTNGTFVVPYAEAPPLKLEPEVMHRIEPGALVFLGTCAFRLESRRAEADLA